MVGIKMSGDIRSLSRDEQRALDRMAEPSDFWSRIRASAVQRRGWEKLQTIPLGETRSYARIAADIGQPTAVRAVARACASNPVAVIIPCHRVVASDGKLTGYRWGVERKKQLLKLERAAIQA